MADRFDRHRVECQDCQNKKSPPVGMVRWPTDEDDYICIVCLREMFGKLTAQLEEWRGDSEKQRERRRAAQKEIKLLQNDLICRTKERNEARAEVERLRGLIEDVCVDCEDRGADRYLCRVRQDKDPTPTEGE